MKYVGLQQQIRTNNLKSIFLLLSFPSLILVFVWVVVYFIAADNQDYYNINPLQTANERFLLALPYVIIITTIWFLIAYFSNTALIKKATKSKTLARKENKRVYNLVENLCISQGMTMPKVNIIESGALNAFASGIDKRSYTVTFTRGIIDQLDDEELEGVIAHELAHIQNKDVRLLIISIIFVGIFSFIINMIFRSFFYGRSKKRDARVFIIIFIAAIVAYFLSMLFKLALSRKREYMADAAAANMTRKPWGLANALKKISGNHRIETVKNKDVANLFIENKPSKKSFFSNIFATHPPIEKRIQVLEQF